MDTGPKRHLVEFISQEDIDDRIIQKGVRIVYPGQEYSNLNYLIRHRARNENVHHFAANQISRKYLTHDLESIPRDAFTLPRPAVVDKLLEAYFQHVNPFCPILDETIFMAQYKGRDPQNPPSLLVLQACLMVGAHVSLEGPDRDEMKASFFRRAKMLFDARFEGNRDVVVQAALLLTWSSEGRFNMLMLIQCFYVPERLIEYRSGRCRCEFVLLDRRSSSHRCWAGYAPRHQC